MEEELVATELTENEQSILAEQSLNMDEFAVDEETDGGRAKKLVKSWANGGSEILG